MDSGRPAYTREREVTLLETLDRLLNKGVVVAGDVTLSVADVDLIYAGLRILLCSVESAGMGEMRESAGCEVRGAKTIPTSESFSKPTKELRTPQPLPACPPRLSASRPRQAGVSACPAQAGAGGPKRINADPEKVEHGLLKLVLTVVELLRRLMEQQALRRVEAGSLTPDEIERMGVAFLRLEEKMTELLAYFHLRKEDLTLSLGPLGDLM